MNNERVIQIVINDIQNDKLKAEQELERVINDKQTDIDSRISQIKKSLKRIGDCEGMLVRWLDYTTVQPEKSEKNNNAN